MKTPDWSSTEYSHQTLSVIALPECIIQLDVSVLGKQPETGTNLILNNTTCTLYRVSFLIGPSLGSEKL